MIRLPIDLKKNQPQTTVLIILVSLIGLVIYYWLFMQPQLVRLADVFARMRSTRADLKAAGSDIARIDQFKNNIRAYKEKVDQYEKRLPVETEIPSLLEDLSNMAKSSNIKIVGITPVTKFLGEEKIGKDQIYREMPISINAKSGYHELGQFLSNLENADRFMKVTGIDIRSNKASPRRHDVELVVSTFILLKEK